MSLVFKHKDTIQVVTLATTKNDKIESNKKRKIVQTYTFSYKQFELVKKRFETNEAIGMKNFFSNADSNCLDCPFNSYGKCYTHKFNQYVGFISSLKSVFKKFGSIDNIPNFDISMLDKVTKMSKGTYVRFGTYGEPSLHPIELIRSMVKVCDNWTGYTHQWNKTNLGDYFMASTHTTSEQQSAEILGYRSFVATENKLGYVGCPASKEMGYKSSCSACNLCSGKLGTKTNKSIEIILH
jgi:hypothetical protein